MRPKVVPGQAYPCPPFTRADQGNEACLIVPCPTTPLWIVLRRRNCSPELLLHWKTRKVVNVAGAEPCLPPANLQSQSCVCLLARDSRISNWQPLPSLASSATRLHSFYYSIGCSTSR